MKYVIIGAVAGGASTAARLRRNDEHAEIVIFEKGEYISYANCGLPYYIGDVITNRNALFVQTATSFNKRFNIDVRTITEITEINRSSKTVTARNQTTGEVYTESYDKLVLSPGAEPVRPPLPGISGKGIFTLRNVADTDFIKAYVQKEETKKAVVIGAGFIGLEMAENLHFLGLDVTVIEMADQVLTPVDFPIAAILQQHIRSKGVHLQLNTSVTGFEQTETGLKVLLNNGNVLESDIVILSIGVKPDTRLAANAGLTIGTAKGIYVNEYLQTSDNDIYAVGDAIEYPNPLTNKPMITYLAGPANKQGRICADNMVFGHHHSYKGSINTAIVKVFDMTVGTAGVASKNLKLDNISHQVSTITGGSHAGYYPGSKQMTIQLAFDPEDGRILSAQIAGFDGVDKRLDIISSIIKHNGTIDDLAEFEHAYAPPFSSAKDPVNMAAFAAENIISKRSVVFYWNEFDKITSDDILIDVRTIKEYQAGKIADAINIPLDELRSGLPEIPKGKNVYIYCLGGLRGYLAQRILMQNGNTDTFNLSGGYQLWNTCIQEMTLSIQKQNKIEIV
jgi:NADPH-dependent 2,4-dienoyl-CoA reductase/sulfur reductase-like enzyme/rhodanese-related sulfurtransferase